MDDAIIAAIQVGLPLTLLVVTYFVGGAVERRHYQSIHEREARWRSLPAVNFRTPPSAWVVVDSELITGSVVISVDYFKRFLAGLRMIFGGQVKSYETLLDRARREALLRLKRVAIQQGYHAIINVRLETTRMANGRGGQGVAGLEVLAYGTGLKLRTDPA
jgi:uncharacterized protein YbjQ (UPF0145 family)